MARPRIEIDKDSFEKLCGLQCTKAEICGFFDITDKTLDAWCTRTYKKGFSDIFEQKRGAGKISLRRAQFRLAEHNAAMAIFLGKNYLGQTDNPQTVTEPEAATSDDALTAALREEAAKMEAEDAAE